MSENGGTGLRERIAGSVVEPGDVDYDDARGIFNAMIDKRPAVIARCAGADDVAAALAFARERELEVAVRSGGHSVAGASLSDGGLVIDMRSINAVSVDAAAQTATVAGGATWSDVDRAAEPHGLATTGGRVSTTGVAGLTLGGGSGWLERKFGLACDNLIAAELVTADGRTVTASEQQNPELFWALHGGGGNFGVVTSLQFRLHALPAITIALLLWPADRGPEVVSSYAELIRSAPDELGGGVLYLTGPPEEFVPEQLVGKLACGVLVTYAGAESEAPELIAPLLALEPEGQMVATLPYAELQCMLDDPPGYRNYWSAEALTELSDPAIDLFCDRAYGMVIPSPSQHALIPWGGAVARQAGDWPVSNRDAAWQVHPFGLWEDPADDERGIAWARAVCADMRPFAAGGALLNFTGDEGEERIVSGYGGQDNYDRLAAVKAEYDPDNVFHLNHNVRPRALAGG